MSNTPRTDEVLETAGHDNADEAWQLARELEAEATRLRALLVRCQMIMSPYDDLGLFNDMNVELEDKP